MIATRVSFEAAREVLASRPEIYISQKLPLLEKACRCVKCVVINDRKYLMICGGNPNHPGSHEDIDGGVYW